MHLCPNWDNISQNLSEEDLESLDYDIEDSYSIDWTELGPSLSVYAITFIAGILGNVLILIAVIRNTQFLKSSPVNVFLGSLASADLLLISICLPLKLGKLFSYTWTMGEVSCKLLYYLQGVSGICSALNLTSLSIERYYVIVHPLKAQYLCTVRKAQKTVVLTWIIAFVLAYPVTMVQVHMEVGFKYCGYFCVRSWDTPLWWQAQEIYFLVVILVIPTTIMIFAYTRIIFEICRVFVERSRMARESLLAQSRKISAHSPDHKKSTVRADRKQSEHNQTSGKIDMSPSPQKTNVVRNGQRERNASSDGLEIKSSNTIEFEDISNNEIELMPLNSPAKSSDRPDSRIIPSRFDENKLDTKSKKRKTTPVITLKLSKKKKIDGRDTSDEKEEVKLDEETKQIVRMLISIVILYIICWAPLLIFNVLHSFATTISSKSLWHIPEQLHSTHKHLKTAFSLMAYFNSCLNPIIYGFMSKNFRKSFLFNIRKCCKCKASKCSNPNAMTPTRAVSGFSRRHRNHSVASFATSNTTTHRCTQDTNVFTTNNKNVIELS